MVSTGPIFSIKMFVFMSVCGEVFLRVFLADFGCFGSLGSFGSRFL
jgi:hypothetical protein